MSRERVSESASAPRVAARPPRPILIFDGDCGFCRHWIARWRVRWGGRVDAAPYQEAAARFPEIAESSFRRSVHLVEPDGRVTTGAHAVLTSLAAAPGGGALLAAYRRVPGFAPAAEAAYRLVAANRPFFSRWTRRLWGTAAGPPEFRVARRLLLQGLALVYLIAFVSLAVQIAGLAGESGILPARDLFEAARERMGPERYLALPSLAWLGSGAAALQGLCWAGAAASLILLAGFAPGPILVLLWALYLSLGVACRVFLSFQWDVLLLEAGFLGIFLAPARLRFDPSREAPPSGVALFLVRWLLFRLMLGSGIVKLTSGDDTWWSLAALRVHYETQPIPTWTAWYVHNLPDAVHRVSCGAMFVVEIVVPFLFFAPRRLRVAAALAVVAFMAVLQATGNYAFFNLLTAVLCLPLVDDASWPAWIRRRLAPGVPDSNGEAIACGIPSPAAGEEAGGGGAGRRAGAGSPRGGPLPPASGRRLRILRRRLALAVAAVVVVASGLDQARRARLVEDAPEPFATLLDAVQPFRSLNAYGLFARMTTSRPEIVVEGSDDGTTWRAYEFRWKPGDPARAPAFVAPHQPRLDWQMWFAALARDCRRAGWFVELEARLLEGSPAVLDLIASNPFPGRPPARIRALLYDYRFTDPAARARDGAWWRRELTGIYCPPATRGALGPR